MSVAGSAAGSTMIASTLSSNTLCMEPVPEAGEAGVEEAGGGQPRY